MSDDERRALAKGMTYYPAPGANLAKLADAYRSGSLEALRERYDELFPESEELSKR